MNCRQGDWARIIKANFFPEHLGRLVYCIKLAEPGDFGGTEYEVRFTYPYPVWVVESASQVPLRRMLVDGTEATPNRLRVIGDQFLKPIRDPGEDAVDETLQRIGTPAQKAMRELESELGKLREITRELKELQKVLER